MLQFWATKWQKVKPDHRKSSSRRYRLRWTLTRRNGPLSRLRFINHASSCSSENGRTKKNADGRPRSAMAAMTFKRFQFRKTMPRNRSARVRFLNGQYLCRRIRSSFFIFFFYFVLFGSVGRCFRVGGTTLVLPTSTCCSTGRAGTGSQLASCFRAAWLGAWVVRCASCRESFFKSCRGRGVKQLNAIWIISNCAIGFCQLVDCRVKTLDSCDYLQWVVFNENIQ